MGRERLTNHGEETAGNGSASNEKKDNDPEKGPRVFAGHRGKHILVVGRHDELRLSTMAAPWS